jgi:hypothetical protein
LEKEALNGDTNGAKMESRVMTMFTMQMVTPIGMEPKQRKRSQSQMGTDSDTMSMMGRLDEKQDIKLPRLLERVWHGMTEPR